MEHLGQAFLVPGPCTQGKNNMTDSAKIAQADKMMLDRYGLGKDVAKTEIERNPIASAIHQTAILIIAELLAKANEPGQAGTHAYDMLAAYAKADLNTTEALIHMVAATVLKKLIDEEGGGRANISISPMDMDELFKEYHVKAERNGLITTISIHAIQADDYPALGQTRLLEQNEDTSGALPQAEPKPERPVWGVRYARLDGEPRFFTVANRDDAETVLRSMNLDPTAHIENRMCQHETCPSNVCNEVTSEG